MWVNLQGESSGGDSVMALLFQFWWRRPLGVHQCRQGCVPIMLPSPFNRWWLRMMISQCGGALWIMICCHQSRTSTSPTRRPTESMCTVSWYQPLQFNKCLFTSMFIYLFFETLILRSISTISNNCLILYLKPDISKSEREKDYALWLGKNQINDVTSFLVLAI